jgi:hypothetical protein
MGKPSASAKAIHDPVCTAMPWHWFVPTPSSFCLGTFRLKMHPRLLETDNKLRIQMGGESIDRVRIAEHDGREPSR